METQGIKATEMEVLCWAENFATPTKSTGQSLAMTVVTLSGELAKQSLEVLCWADKSAISRSIHEGAQSAGQPLEVATSSDTLAKQRLEVIRSADNSATSRSIHEGAESTGLSLAMTVVNLSGELAKQGLTTKMLNAETGPIEH